MKSGKDEMEAGWCEANPRQAQKKGKHSTTYAEWGQKRESLLPRCFWARIGIALGRDNKLTTVNTVVK